MAQLHARRAPEVRCSPCACSLVAASQTQWLQHAALAARLVKRDIGAILAATRLQRRHLPLGVEYQRESSLFTTKWSGFALSPRCTRGPASCHGSLISLFPDRRNIQRNDGPRGALVLSRVSIRHGFASADSPPDWCASSHHLSLMCGAFPPFDV